MDNGKLKIAVADDHSLVLNGFLNFLATELPLAEVYPVQNKIALFELLERQEIDILFQDVKFGRYDAREFVKPLKEAFPALKIVVISTLGDELTVNMLFKQGVQGYVSKSDGSDEILAAIEAVQRGQTYFSAAIRENTATHQITNPSKVVLTSREKEVLATIISGKTIKEAAEELFLSEKTIETYRSNLFLKFDVTNMASLVKRAILEGYL